MMPSEIIQKTIPGISEEMIDYIIWCRTPHPFKALTAREVYKAADRWRRAQDHGIFLCEFCNNEARHDDWVCSKCERALNIRYDR